MKTRLFSGGVALGLVMVAALMLLLSSGAPAAAQNTACYRPAGGAAFVCGDGGAFQVLDGGSLTAETGSIVTLDDVTAAGTLTAADLAYTPATTLTVTGGGTITPVGSLQLLSAGGAVGAALGAATGNGMVMLVNVSANTITITDTSPALLSANAALGQWDSLTVVGLGGTWVEIARSNN